MPGVKRVTLYLGTTVPRMVRIMNGSIRPNTFVSRERRKAEFFARAKAKAEGEYPALITIEMPWSELREKETFRYGNEEDFIMFLKTIDPKYILSGIPIPKEDSVNQWNRPRAMRDVTSKVHL